MNHLGERIGLAPDKFRMVNGTSWKGIAYGASAKTNRPSQLCLHWQKDPVQTAIQFVVTVRGDEIQALDHAEQEILKLMDYVEEIFAVEDVVSTRLLAQVRNKLHGLLMVFEQSLKLLEDLRKCYKISLPREEPVREFFHQGPHFRIS